MPTARCGFGRWTWGTSWSTTSTSLPQYDGVMDLAKAAIARMGVDTGVDVDIESEAPPGSGLGGSSALVTAVVAGLAMVQDRALTAKELAELSYAVERDDLDISGGWQDQYAAAFGGCNLIEFRAAGPPCRRSLRTLPAWRICDAASCCATRATFGATWA